MNVTVKNNDIWFHHNMTIQDVLRKHLFSFEKQEIL